MLDWTTKDIFAYVAKYDVPISNLYQKGYTSIGCAPCTRPITSGESERAGRWWWEESDNRECGLHVDAHGRLVREVLSNDKNGNS